MDSHRRTCRGEHGTDDRCTGHPRLAPLRVREPAASRAVLAGGTGRIEHHFLGDATGSCCLDGTLAHGRAERAVARFSAIVDEIAPDTILTFGSDSVTGHPDHRAVSAWTDRALDQVSWTGTRLLHRRPHSRVHRRFGDLFEQMDSDPDVFPVITRRQLAVELTLRPAELDREVAALAAPHQPDRVTGTSPSARRAAGPSSRRRRSAGRGPAPGRTYRGTQSSRVNHM